MKQLYKIIFPLLGRTNFLKCIFLGTLSGIFSFLFINFMTQVISLIVAGNLKSINKDYICIFSALILFFVWTRRTLSLLIINLSQELFRTLRRQILSLILKSDYQQLLPRKVKIYSTLVNDVNVLTQASVTIIDFSTSSIVAIFCLVYLVSLSGILFLITLAVAFLGITIYHHGAKKNNQNFQIARSLEDNFIESFKSILDGFKEINMEPRKGKDIYDNQINVIANRAYMNNTKAFTGFLNNQITGQVLFYILISSVLLFFSVVLEIDSSDTVRFVFVLLYLLNAIELIMVLLPGLMKAKIAAKHITDLKSELEKSDSSQSNAEKSISKHEFDQINIKKLEFNYDRLKHSFGIGPINFIINKGEIIFIYGGNGSGKTTFIYTILGLCEPVKGEILLNGVLINSENIAFYRTSFATVFSDFYLFNGLLGLNHIDMGKWNYYLRLFEIEDKVKLENNYFSTTDLSMGQRKRLALIAALLEEKPILVVDEWAADQDPYFRKKFYTEIIPILKQEGIAIIAITHDDKYYHCADKIYKMEYGRITLENIQVHFPNSINNFNN